MDTLVILKPNNLNLICECWHLESCCGIMISSTAAGPGEVPEKVILARDGGRSACVRAAHKLMSPNGGFLLSYSKNFPLKLICFSIINWL